MAFAFSLEEQRERRAAQKALNMRVNCTPSKALRRGNYEGGASGKAIAKEEPVRDEGYRRWVATLPCYECGVVGYSQAAHPNSGKAKGKKLSDELCFPMCCDRPGVVGCHTRFDRYELVRREHMPAYERAALAWTREQQGEKA